MNTQASDLSQSRATTVAGEEVYRAFWALPRGFLNTENLLARLQDRMARAGFPVRLVTSMDLKTLAPEPAATALKLLPTLQTSLDPNVVAERIRRDASSNPF